MDSGVIKRTNESISELKKYEETKRNLHEEQQIFVGQLVKKGLEERTLLGQIKSIKELITAEEEKVTELQNHESQLIVQIKFLQTIREKMARTAS